jgi:hypothetical protein
MLKDSGKAADERQTTQDDSATQAILLRRLAGLSALAQQ